jgi:ribosomal protein L37E
MPVPPLRIPTRGGARWTGAYDARVAERCPRCGDKNFQSCVTPCSQCGWSDQPLGSWVPSAWYADPANPGKSRWWNSEEHHWQGKAKPINPRPIPPQPLDHKALTEGALAVLGQAIVLGGYGFDIDAGRQVLLCFREEELEIWLGDESKAYPYREIVELEVESSRFDDDPKQSGGAGAFLAGGVSASMEVGRLNQIIALTARMTLLRIATNSMEMFLHATQTKPLALRMQLAQPRARIRAARATAPPPSE